MLGGAWSTQHDVAACIPHVLVRWVMMVESGRFEVGEPNEMAHVTLGLVGLKTQQLLRSTCLLGGM